MDLTNPELDNAEQQVISILSQQPAPYSPVDLIRDLRARSISEGMARAAIWYLIDRYEIELTWDRQLKRVTSEPALVR